jgi:hypothetical protein
VVIGSASFKKKEHQVAKADLKHYEDAAGRVFSLDEGDARLLGYTPVDIKRVRARNAEADRMRVAAAENTRLSDREKALDAREAEIAKREKAVDSKTENKGR